jgi:hypothetical protein
MFRSFDCAYMTRTPYPECQAALGYLDSPEAEHVWTDEEWKIVKDLLQIGIWPANFNNHPVDDAESAIQSAKNLRFAAHARHPRIILGDFEAVTDPEWIAIFGDTIRAGGYLDLGYESEVVLRANPTLSGVVVADWNSIPRVGEPPRVAHQYIADVPWENGEVDLTVWDEDMAKHFGHGPRHTL